MKTDEEILDKAFDNGQLFFFNDTTNDAIFLAGYRACEAEQEWKVIDPENLPECPCLVWFETNHQFVALSVFLFGSIICARQGHFNEDYRVTHYKPLPEGPK